MTVLLPTIRVTTMVSTDESQLRKEVAEYIAILTLKFGRPRVTRSTVLLSGHTPESYYWQRDNFKFTIELTRGDSSLTLTVLVFFDIERSCRGLAENELW